MVLRQRGVLVPAESRSAELGIIQRIRFGRIVYRVPAKHAIGWRKDMVDASLAVVVSRRLGERKRELVAGKIRGRKQIQYRPHGRGHRQRLAYRQRLADAASVDDVVGGVASRRHHI